MFIENGRYLMSQFRDILEEEEASLVRINGNELQINEILLIEKLFDILADEKNTSSQLAKVLKITPSAISTMLNKLEKKGYIERHHDNTDRRKVYIIPIGKSKEVKDNCTKYYNSMTQNIQRDNSNDKILVLKKVLDSIEESIKQGGSKLWKQN